MASDDQSAAFELLADPATHGGAKVTRIDTHAACVFLAGAYAFKVKLAVKFPFLDFSTLDKRKAVLEAEITANKPFAPQLYLGLVPITRDNGKLTLGGKGTPVEWALKMRRFDETQTFDHLAPTGRIDRALSEELAVAVADAHARAPIADVEPWLNVLSDTMRQDAEDFAAHPDLFARADADKLTAATRAALQRLRPLLLARGAAGLVRRGHGDLHLGNIALIDDKPVPFDALEFDPVMASGDVFYDLGFDEAEARVLEMRADLMAALREHIEKKNWTQSEAARQLLITQPRISALMKGAWRDFSADMLLVLATRLGLRPTLKLAA